MRISKFGKVLNLVTGTTTTSLRFVKKPAKVFHVKHGGIKTFRLGKLSIQRVTLKPKIDDGISIPAYPNSAI